MPEISGYIFAVCVCCIKIPSNFFYFFNFLPFCTKEVTLSQSLPTMLSMEWPGGFTISWLVQFMGNKFVIYLRIGPLVILQTVVVYIMYQNQQNALHSTGVFLLRYFHLHVSAGNPSIFNVTFLIQEYIVVRCVTLLQIAEIHMIIG